MDKITSATRGAWSIEGVVNRPTVGDIMTKEVVVAFESEPLVDVARRIFDRDFNGLPVIDVNRRVVGIITQYDLVSKGTAIHFPTLIKLLQSLPVLKQEKSLLKEELRPLLELKVKDVMNNEPLTVGTEESIEGLTSIFASHHKVNPILVTDKKGELMGVVSRHDLVKLLAGPSQDTGSKSTKSIDAQINDFVSQFEKRFAVTTKTRAKHWLIFSILFSVIGFFIAFALILRFVIK